MKPNQGSKEVTKWESFRLMFRMWNFVKEYRLRFYIGFIVGSTAPFFFRFLDSYLIEMFTKVCLGNDRGQVLVAFRNVICIMGMGLIVYPFSFGMIYTTYSKCSGEVKRRIFNKALKLPISYIQSKYSGDLVTRITADFSDAIQMVAYPVVGQNNPFSQVFTLLAIAVVIIARSRVLGVVSLILNLVGILIIQKFVIPLRQKEEVTKAISEKAAQGIVDSLSGTMVARIFGLQKRLTQDYETSTEEIYQNNASLVRRKSILNVIIDLQGFLSFVCVYIVGLFLSKKGAITIPDVVFISTLQMSVYRIFCELGEKIAQIQKFLVGTRRLFEFFDAPEEEERISLAEPDKTANIAIKLQNVTFQYESEKEKKAIFEEFNLTIKNGEKIGIAGKSGGGKSTLFKILLEFVEINKGKIEMFGHLTKEYSQNQIRELFSYVPQDCHLFDGTIRENIMLGDLEASEEKLLQAVKDAYLEEFIGTLQDGLDSQVGERGALLSGGQRQRVAIARAFLKNAPILLLDEATSALDSQSESMVQRAINKLMEGRTCLVIAHRLSTIRHMDRILVLEQGKILEEGTYEELVGQKGRFAQLCQLQQ